MTTNEVLLLVALLCWCGVNVSKSAQITEFPPGLPTCYRDDPQLNSCLLNATEVMRPFLRKGVPELKIPPVSPLLVSSLDIQQGAGAINMKVHLDNLTLYGLDTYKFNKFDFDVNKLIFDLDFVLEDIFLKGHYDIAGRILAVPIVGSGTVFINITTQTKGTVRQEAHLKTRKEVQYLKTGKTHLDFHLGNIAFHMDGLFDGNEALAKATNAAIQDNVDVLLEDFRPVLEKVILDVLQNIIQQSASLVPYDTAFPPGKPGS